VKVLTPQSVSTYYRFFGARHSILQLGNLVDFEVEGEDGRFMPRLRSLSQMGFPWLYDKNRLLIWHHFIQRLERHLQDTGEVDPFYYALLLQAAQKWDKQNPKRIICESYLTLLQTEGRLYPLKTCYICENELTQTVALMQGFKPAHPDCIYTTSLSKNQLHTLFETHKTIHLEDDEVEYVYSVVMKGL
jgi:recombinational DNA repair protein (RecF pathway)